MSDNSSAASQAISLPKGGGALHGIGEKFSPDLHTGTGNFTMPIALPSGRNGFTPELNLVYSTGNGNGLFGLGWNLPIPGVARKTSKRIPQYQDYDGDLEKRDVFILSGAEDLVPIADDSLDNSKVTRYRPRTEGLFARILHHHNSADGLNYWEVSGKDGLTSFYGKDPTDHPLYNQALEHSTPAIIRKPKLNPSDTDRIFAWKLILTRDTFGNRIEYVYGLRDQSNARDESEGHQWDQPLLTQIRYADYEENNQTNFLVTVTFNYSDDRADPFSDYRAGFEIRTRKRCKSILIETHTDKTRALREYLFTYENDSFNAVSLLKQIEMIGFDDDGNPYDGLLHNGAIRERQLPPIQFRYTSFVPESRKFFALQGADLPARSLADPTLELVDLFGNGLPDLIEINGSVRYWRNLGNGHFDLPRFMQDAPTDVALSDSGIQFMDANGDGRTDLLVANGAITGYFPLRFDGQWDRRSFQPYHQAPTFNLKDPEVKLIDLDGDGVTDAIRSSSRWEYFFNDPKTGWNKTLWVEREALAVFPDVNLSDHRVKWADLTGDGLQDVCLVYDGNLEYWPNLGYGQWGKRIHMQNSPRFPYGYDPKRILIGDVDGDGLADIVYVEDTKVTLWINRSGNSWSDPITILGTPPVTDVDAVRLLDLLGTGISGILWSRDADISSHNHWFFLDFTGGVKPYLLDEMDNQIGATTRVEYAPSIHFFLEDQKLLATRWQTTLPFPVHVVSCVEVIDHFSQGKLTTQYRYHHGYWDGAEREFRGFAMVEQYDTESFEQYNSEGLHGTESSFSKVEQQYFSPPTVLKTWFHPGPVGDEFGDWKAELDLSAEYWAGDPQILKHTAATTQYLQNWPNSTEGRRTKRDALRALRGSVLRTELYALDNSERQSRPYTVSEFGYSLIELELPVLDLQRRRIFFPHATSQRTTQWERGIDPMTEFSFTRYTNETGEFDKFGRPLANTQIACPRGWRTIDDKPANGFLATHSRTIYAEPIDPKVYIHKSVAQASTYEIRNTAHKSLAEVAALTVLSNDLELIGQTLKHYDGSAFSGLPLGQVGEFGAVTRSRTLVLTDDILQRAYGPNIPAYFQSDNPVWTADYPMEFRTLLPRRAGYSFLPGGAASEPKGYFTDTERRRFDFQTAGGSGRGLVLEVHDSTNDETISPTGHRTLMAYDKYRVLPNAVTDAVGLVTQANYNYRVLQPSEVIDPNGNRSRFTFSPLGLLEMRFVNGKSLAEGDQNRPSIRMEYGFSAFVNSQPANRQPIYVRTIRYIHHDTELDVPVSEHDETITTVEYSDGFGRLLQTRTQGEDLRFGDPTFGGGETVLPADQNAGAGGNIVGERNSDAQNPNVVVSGWQFYNNKGKVIEKCEPFFAVGWEYSRPTENQTGKKARMYYDPRGHVIRTLNADGSEECVVYGVPGTIAVPNLNEPTSFEPTPWEAYKYDANDNSGRTHPSTSLIYEHCRYTPSNTLVDALGRTVRSVERNRDPRVSPGDPLPPIKEFETTTTYDIRGNILTVADPLGRIAFHYVYDLSNNPLRIDGIDGGDRRRVVNAAGALVEQRDANGGLILHAYDDLNRPSRLWARDGVGQALTLRVRLEYGDGGQSNQPPAERTANRAANRLGKLFKQFDEAGLLTFQAYDLKANALEKTRRGVSNNAILSVFSPAPPDWRVEPFRVNWDAPALTPLDPESYVLNIAYDALNRVKTLTYPEDVENGRRKLRFHYNRAGALERVEMEHIAVGGASSDAYVERIAYNAKGQRVLIAYGNGIMTRHSYDEHTFRLSRSRTERFNKPSALTYSPTSSSYQDIAYRYDLVGNILAALDRSPQCGIPGTIQGVDALDRTFSYDALYRLRIATGRECDRPPDLPWDENPRCTDLTKVRAYTEEYQYDLASNIKQLKHSATVSFTRDLELVAGSNRLHAVTVGPTAFDYNYDANGNMTGETTSRHFEWDYGNRMRVYRTQTDGSEPSVYVHYFYDASGQRVKKLVRKQGGTVELSIYIDGVFEYQRIVTLAAEKENNTLHVLDNQKPIAMVRVGTPFTQDLTPAIKYQLPDHLGSTVLVVDQLGNEINREEYTPYGETCFGAFALKRYRFANKERDEESSLYYFGARYYSPWLGRWASCDPAERIDGENPYWFVRDNPLRFVDRVGYVGEEATNLAVAQQSRADNLAKNVEAYQEEIVVAARGHEANVRAYNQATQAMESANQQTQAGRAQYDQALEAQKTAQRCLLDDQANFEKLAEKGRTQLSEIQQFERQVTNVKSTLQQSRFKSQLRGGDVEASLDRAYYKALDTNAEVGQTLNELKTVRQAVSEAAEVAQTGRVIRTGIQVSGEAAGAAEAGEAGTAARAGRRFLRIGGAVLFVGTLGAGVANEQGLWDFTVGGTLHDYQTGAAAVKSAYEGGKAAVKSWLSLGSNMNQQVRRYSSGR